MDIEWEDGRREVIDFPEHLATYVDEYLTELEEERNEEDFTTTEPQGKVYDPPMTDTEQYLLNKEREEEHKSYDY